MVTKRGNAGYTLIEVMLVVAIIGLVASIGAGVLIQINKAFILSKARIEIQEQARGAMYIITRELHEAKVATIVIDRSSATQPFYSRITFTKIQGQQVRFNQVGNSLHIIKGNNDSIITRDLAYLAFTFPRSDDMSIVSVSMTLEKRIYQGQIKTLHMASEQIQVMN